MKKSVHCCNCGEDFSIDESLENNENNDSCPHCGNEELMYIIDSEVEDGTR